MSDSTNQSRRKVLAGLVAAGAAAATGCATADKQEMEKCYGIVKAGMNDCGSGNHACAGQAKVDGDPEEWIYLPKGTCEKIVGGKVK